MNKSPKIILLLLTTTLLISNVCNASDKTTDCASTATSTASSTIAATSTEASTQASTVQPATQTPESPNENYTYTTYSIVYDDFFATIEGTNFDPDYFSHNNALSRYASIELDNHKYYVVLNNTKYYNYNLNELSTLIEQSNMSCRTIYVEDTDTYIPVGSKEELINTLKNYPVEQWTRIYLSDGTIIVTTNRSSNLELIKFNDKIVYGDFADTISYRDYLYLDEVLSDRILPCAICTVVIYEDKNNSCLKDSLQERLDDANNSYYNTDLPSSEDYQRVTDGCEYRYIPKDKRVNTGDSSNTLLFLQVPILLTGIIIIYKKKFN